MNDEVQQEKIAKAEKDLAFAQLEVEYAEVQAKVQAHEASEEEVARYNDLANQIVELRQGLRGHRDRLRELEGVPEGDGVATPDTIHASAGIHNPGGS